MKKVQFKSQERDGYLFVVSSGTRGTFMDSVDAIGELVKIIRQSNTRYILADYREVHYELGNSELFSITRYIENKQPDFLQLTMATVISNAQSEAAAFWESIFEQRGFRIRTFECIEDAENWIKAEMERIPNPDSQV